MEVGVIGKVVAAVLAMFIAMQVPTPSQADWRWLNQYRQPAFDALMPVNRNSKPLVAYPLVTYRSFRDLYQNVQERYFTIAFADGPGGFDRDRLVATVVVPAGQSIQQQLLNLHMKDRQASFDALIAKVAVRRYLIKAEECPAVRIRMDELSKVAITLPERGVVSLHPILHRIVIHISGMEIDATINDDDNPVVRWAAGTSDALLACTG